LVQELLAMVLAVLDRQVEDLAQLPWDQVIKSHVIVCLFDQPPAVPCDQVELALAMAREAKS
jgi:hypothetical protein